MRYCWPPCRPLPGLPLPPVTVTPAFLSSVVPHAADLHLLAISGFHDVKPVFLHDHQRNTPANSNQGGAEGWGGRGGALLKEPETRESVKERLAQMTGVSQSHTCITSHVL